MRLIYYVTLKQKATGVPDLVETKWMGNTEAVAGGLIITGNFVSKAGDTMTGALTLPTLIMAMTADVTIASDTSPVVGSNYQVVGEGNLADDLKVILGATAIGQLLILRANNTATDITVKNYSTGTDNIKCGSDRILSSTEDTITLMWDGTYWVMISFADNA